MQWNEATFTYIHRQINPINITFFLLHENNMKTPRALEIELVELFASPNKHALNKFRPIVQHNLFSYIKKENKKKRKKGKKTSKIKSHSIRKQN